MAVNPLSSSIELLETFGFFKVVLPMILVFAVFFGVLEKTGVCGVYGSGFGEYGKGHVRFTFLPTLEILEIVFNLLEDFLK